MRTPKPPGSRRPIALPVDTSPTGLVALGTVLALGTLLPNAVRWIMLPLALVLPGLAFVSAVFGPAWRSVGVRLGLASIITLATYPMLAMATAAVVTRVTQRSVAVTVWAFIVGCAVVAAVRERRRPSGPVAGAMAPAMPLRGMALPAVAMVASLGITLAGILWLPKRAPEQYSAVALTGLWALVDGELAMTPGTERTVSFELRNRTDGPVTYRVTARIPGGPEWRVVEERVRVEAGDGRSLSATGSVAPGMCRGELLIGVSPDDGAQVDPLRLFVRDSTADCAAEGG